MTEKEIFYLYVDPFTGEERHYMVKPPLLKSCRVEILHVGNGEVCERTYTYNRKTGRPVQPRCGINAPPWTIDDHAPEHYGSTPWLRVRTNAGEIK